MWPHEYPQRTRGEKWIAFIDGEREFEYWGIVIDENFHPHLPYLTWEDEPLEVFLYSKKEGTQYDFGFDDGYKEGYDAALEKDSRIF